MNPKRLLASLLIFVGVVGTLLGINLAAGNTPVLGLDLKGGLSVIYATAEPADQDQLTIVRDLMREQLESFGIAEPDIRVEGENIIVDLPGVSDQEAAFDALKVSGIVTLRPVLQCQAAAVTDEATSAGATTSTTAPAASTTAPAVEEEGAGLDELGAPAGRSRAIRTPSETTTPPETTSPPETTTPPETTSPSGTAVPTETTAPADDVPPTTAGTPVGTPTSTTTVPTQPAAGSEVLPYPGVQQSCLVGPSGGTGEVFTQGSARADIDQQTGQWVVNVDLRSDGQVVWNALAQQCFSATATCPTGQLAIALDDVIQSAPVVRTPDFPGNVQISGSFTEDEVRSLARVLNRGAFPVPVEQQRVETVSPTAGQDSLDAAVIAGLAGLALVLLCMIAYYRKLSVVIITGLIIWGMTVFSLATFVSQATNYALTLAGATGIIVAVGVTVDTYVVFFERLRDEMRHGRTLRNAAPRSFQSTWRTILSADLVSLLASIVLFWLSVGSVKGFALYLGLTTICDLIVFYFFTRPAVYLLSTTRWFDRTVGRPTPAGAPA